jgi:chromosome segregation and condensation protein ScpB
MRVAQQTHLVAVQLDQREIDLDLVELGYRAALGGDLPTMEQTIEQIRRLHKNALQVARAIALGNPVPRRLTPAIRDRVLKLLLQAGIVEHVARGDWRIVNPLFRDYLRRLDPLG